MSTEKPFLENFDESRRLQRFTHIVTIGLIIGCNALLFLGLWVSGVDLEAALAKPELYDPANGHCVGVQWEKVAGAEGLVKVCTEWLAPSAFFMASRAFSKVSRDMPITTLANMVIKRL